MLDNSWKRWVAENKLLNTPDQEIIATLQKNGIDEQSAKAELSTINDNPYFQAAYYHTELLHKRHCVAMIQRELYKLDPKHNVIERRSNVSRAEFLEKYYAAHRPVILCGEMKNWAAVTRWTPEYFKEKYGDVMINISADREKNPDYETQADAHRRSIKFSDYIDLVENNDETNDYYITARDGFFRIPEVRSIYQDMANLDNYLDPSIDGLNMWYGPKGTYTPLHHDPLNIFMAQVRGRKRIRMIPATELDIVYNDRWVYSPIDFRNPDYTKFPKFREASIIDLILAPGEVLFLPVGWWHEVTALDVSITVSLTNFVFPNFYKWVHPTHPNHRKTPPKPAEKSQPKAAAQAQPKATAQTHPKAKQEPERIINTSISDDWLKWIDENIKRGCDPVGIVEILEKNYFSIAAIKLAMGDSFPKNHVADNSEDPPNVDYVALSEVPVAHMEWLSGFKHIEDPKLQLYTLDNFLSEKECDEIIKIINTNLRPSTVTVYIEGFRTSYSSDLCHIKNPLIEEVDKKICSALGIRQSFSEGIQAQKYEVGQEFKAHTDFFEPGTEEYKIHAGKRGNRTWTFMIYLNDTPKGGGTSFVNIDKTFYPKKGSAVIWNSLYPNGKPNRDSKHWGMPVEEGQKYVITKWFREKGTGHMFFNDAAN